MSANTGISEDDIGKYAYHHSSVAYRTARFIHAIFLKGCSASRTKKNESVIICNKIRMYNLYFNRLRNSRHVTCRLQARKFKFFAVSEFTSASDEISVRWYPNYSECKFRGFSIIRTPKVSHYPINRRREQTA